MTDKEYYELAIETIKRAQRYNHDVFCRGLFHCWRDSGGRLWFTAFHQGGSEMSSARVAFAKAYSELEKLEANHSPPPSPPSLEPSDETAYERWYRKWEAQPWGW